MSRCRGVRSLGLTLLAVGVCTGPELAHAQLVIGTQFDPTGVSDSCGLGFDSGTNEIWVHGCFGADIQRYSTAGTFLGAVARGGESANDVDVEVATPSFRLGATTLPANALLYINGETGGADLYAIDKASGSILSTLNAAFGASHVVGGAYHPTRGTLFLVQDKVPGGANANRIAEVDPQTGALLNSFQISSTFSVNFGDMDVCNGTGNLLVVSSDEARVGEYTPEGTLVQYHPLPVGVSSVSGIGVDDRTGDLWVASSASQGDVFRLTGGPCPSATVPALGGRGLLTLVGLMLAVAFVSATFGTRRAAREIE